MGCQMRITNVRASNFLSLFSVDWNDIDPSLQVIVGPNGSGKTNVLRVMQAVTDVLSQDYRIRWGSASTRGTNDPAFNLVVGFELDDAWEETFLQAFLQAAMCDMSAAMGGAGMTQEFGQVLADAYFRGGRTVNTTPLRRGQLNVRRYTTDQWACWIDFHDAGTWRLNLDPMNTLALATDPPKQLASPITVQWDMLQEQPAEATAGTIFGTSPSPVVVDLASLVDRATLRMEVRNSGAPLPTHQALWRLLSLAPGSADLIDARRIFAEIFRRQLIVTANVRSIRGDVQLTTPAEFAADLAADGANLATYLFALKNGDDAARARYDDIGAQFRRLAKRNVDVRMQVGAGDNSQRLTLYCGQPGAMDPLDFSGAGVAEALFIAAVMSSPGRVLLLDEPGANLQHGTQVRLLQALAQSPNQALVVTHSQLLVPVDDRIARVARFAMHHGITRLIHPSLDRLRPHLPKITQELRASSDARALLFADAIVLVEGDSELGTFLEWNRRAQVLDTSDANIQILSVDGDQEFPIYVFLAELYEMPWAIVCDGRAIDDRGRKGLAKQLEAIGVQHGVTEGGDFGRRKSEFAQLNVHTLADAPTEQIEQHQCIATHLDEARQALGTTSKPRLARWVAERYECPHAVAILREISARFGQP
jgi:energy-coupling factor transporter ATP-binding protein EcfA2